MHNDPLKYLGHYAKPENLARGHNQGAPGVEDNPTLNPISATGLASLADTAAASMAGGGSRSGIKLHLPRGATGTPGTMTELGLRAKNPIRGMGGRRGSAPRGIKPVKRLKSGY
jgi:hypothetical protein